MSDIAWIKNVPPGGQLYLVLSEDLAGNPRIQATAYNAEDSGMIAFWDYPEGLVITEPTRIPIDAAGLAQHIQATDEFSIYLHITSANANTPHMARIFSWGLDSNTHNLLLGTWSNAYYIRIRTSETDPNGMPELIVPGATTQETALVLTHTAGGIDAVYLNGALARSEPRSGSLSVWAPAYNILLANEHGQERAWLGTIRRIALYNRALSAEEIAKS